MFGNDLLDAMRTFKRLWDPDSRMNPGKVIDAYGPEENLRTGPEHRPPALRTHFSFRSDGGSFARATERCFGVGKCRSLAGTMCPSFQATREEMHTTRGRAHLLFELMKGDPLEGGWRDQHVKEALELCLACKACKAECPVNVDVATYKAEFLAHYYERRPRPLAAYAFGLVDRWARLAARSPGVANVLARLPGAKPLLGVAPSRRLPRFASETFREWFVRRGDRRDGERILLWPDTFNNHFRPETARAAVSVLEAAGFRVDVPPPDLCCGRPLYDFGMLTTARRYLDRIVAALRDDIRAGVPVVVLEPSCASVFRDELPNLLAGEPDAEKLAAQVRLLPDVLAERLDRLNLRPLGETAIVHGHCHQKALFGLGAEHELLREAGLELVAPESGCCGMAGSFGYDRSHYEVSVACAERVLLPAIRSDADALVVSDGFSCREQVEQLAGRPTLHVAQVLERSLA
jgi:Fe-S oxidoreductase